METNKQIGISPEVLKDMGLSEEFIKQALEKGPSVHSHATGGEGGKAINLTYVDNYSTLLLVYTFLHSTLTGSEDDRRPHRKLNEALLETLRTSLKEQQTYRKEFLKAVDILRNS